MKILNLKQILALPEMKNISENQRHEMKCVDGVYKVKVSDYYLSLALKSDAVFRQAFPSKEELNCPAFVRIDEDEQIESQPVRGLVRKYKTKVVILTTNNCFMNCRHCTRKGLINEIHKIETPDYDAIYEYLRKNTEINDVLLTGGDALSLSDAKLDEILSNLNSIKSINSIRIGTRAPVTFPARITSNLCAVLEKYENIWVNTHFNHPDEFTSESIDACKKLQKCGITICNQTVFLKCINDDYATMYKLCLLLVHNRIVPYYLYQCDPISGVTHFISSPKKAKEIVQKLRRELPGNAVPKFVVESLDGRGKTIVETGNIVCIDDKSITLSDYNNEIFRILYE